MTITMSTSSATICDELYDHGNNINIELIQNADPAIIFTIYMIHEYTPTWRMLCETKNNGNYDIFKSIPELYFPNTMKINAQYKYFCWYNYTEDNTVRGLLGPNAKITVGQKATFDNFTIYVTKIIFEDNVDDMCLCDEGKMYYLIYLNDNFVGGFVDKANNIQDGYTSPKFYKNTDNSNIIILNEGDGGLDAISSMIVVETSSQS